VLARPSLVHLPRVVFHADIVAKKVEIRVALLYVPRDPMGCVSPTGKVRADMLHIRACPHDVIDNLEQALRVIGQRSILGARRRDRSSLSSR
jgi:hypothetical protein